MAHALLGLGPNFRSCRERSGGWLALTEFPMTSRTLLCEFSRHWIDLRAPCQYALYPFRYDAGSLRFHPAGGRETRESSHCPKSLPLSAVETGLVRASRHALKDGGLTLLDDHDHPIMAFSRVIAAGLENREWSISEYWNGTALVVAEHPAHIVFRNGGVDGLPACGALMGHYSLSGQHLKLWVTAREPWTRRGQSRRA
jgi:hypothetical protein